TAARLLQQYGGLDELIGHVAEVPGKVGENLRTGLTTLELSRRLATIRADLTLPLSVEELAPGPPDSARLRELYTRYELRALLRQLEGGDAVADSAATSVTHSPPAPPAAPGAGAAAAVPPAGAGPAGTRAGPRGR